MDLGNLLLQVCVCVVCLCLCMCVCVSLYMCVHTSIYVFCVRLPPLVSALRVHVVHTRPQAGLAAMSSSSFYKKYGIQPLNEMRETLRRFGITKRADKRPGVCQCGWMHTVRRALGLRVGGAATYAASPSLSCRYCPRCSGQWPVSLPPLPLLPLQLLPVRVPTAQRRARRGRRERWRSRPPSGQSDTPVPSLQEF